MFSSIKSNLLKYMFSEVVIEAYFLRQVLNSDKISTFEKIG